MELIAKSRKHGLEIPFHPIQILSWVISIYNACIFIIIILPQYDEKNRIIFSTIFSILLLTFIVTGYLVSKSDPTDPSVHEYKYCKDVR